MCAEANKSTIEVYVACRANSKLEEITSESYITGESIKDIGIKTWVNYRMAQTTKWLPAILDYMKNVMLNISTCMA